MTRNGSSGGKRAYEGGTVAVNYEGGRPVGSRISTELGVFRMPHWPSRIKDVRSELGGLIVVETRAGERRFFGPEDALEEGGSDFLEATTGSSMGGHSPKAHGKIRFIVRAFGKWAGGGKQHICVKRLLAEHPEIVGGDSKRANALCFAEGTLVQTRDRGLVEIENLLPGEDWVKTHRGRWRPVEATVCANRAYEGEMVEVETALSPHAIKVTANHQMLVVKGVTHNGRGARVSTRVERKRLGMQSLKGNRGRAIEAFFREALASGPRTTEELRTEAKVRGVRWGSGTVYRAGRALGIDASNHSGGTVWTPPANWPEEEGTADAAVAVLDVEAPKDRWSYAPHGEEVVECRADELASDDYLVYPVTRDVHDRPEIHDDLLRLAGWYAAEGCIVWTRPRRNDTPRVIFSLGPTDDNIARDIEDIVERLFGVSAKRYAYAHGRGYNLSVRSADLALFLRDAVGEKAHAKRFAAWVMALPAERLRLVLDAYWEGDGHIRPNRQEAVASTVSRDLAIQLRDILLYLGHSPSLGWSDWHVRHPGVRSIGKRQVSIQRAHPIWLITYAFDPVRTLGKRVGDYYLLPIRALRKGVRQSFSQPVYTAQIADDHSLTLLSSSQRNCAWLKDLSGQWTGTTKWRGSSKSPKQVAQDLGIEAKANATAYARFSHAMPELTNAELDMLVEALSDMRPIEDMLSELGIDAEGHDPFVVLAENDAARNVAAVGSAEAKLRSGEDLAEAMGMWLAAHGDVKPLVESQLAPAVQRVLTGEGPLAPINDLDKRVTEAMRIGKAVEPWDMQAPQRAPLVEADEKAENRSTQVTITLPPQKQASKPTVVIEGDYVESGELGAPRAVLMRMPLDDLSDRARELYEASAEPDFAGRRYLSSCGRVELARIVERLERDFAAERTQREEKLAEAAADGNDLETDPQYRIAPDTVGWDRGAEKGGEPHKRAATELDTVTLREPPNLRRGYMSSDRHRPHACAGCLNFADGGCRAYGNYPVSAGEVCDSFQSTHPLDEADGYMTRSGEDVGHYARIGSGMALHLHRGLEGDFEEPAMRMGMARLADPENPTSEVYAGHIRIRHREGEHCIEPDWESHPDPESNPELAKYATIRHGARHAVELANSRSRAKPDAADAVTEVDSGTPDSPANAQWPLMPQIGESASAEEVAEAITTALSEKWVSWGKWKASHPQHGSKAAPHAGHIPAVLRVGTHGPYVKRAKNHLFKRDSGHFPHAAAGPRYNREFHKAVRQFQRAHGLQVDGIIGKQTLAAIRGNRNASKVAPGALTHADKHWLREGDVPESASEVADRIIEELGAGAPAVI